MNKLLTILLATIPFLAFASIRTFRAIDFNQNCGGYLERAANSNTIELAKTEMSRAVQYIDKKGLNSGHTSVIYDTPDEDVGFWSNNMKSSLEELQSIKVDSSPLERSNVLMKLRDTLTDNGESGTQLIYPEGISVHPNNTFFFFFGLSSFLLAAVVVGKEIIEVI